MHALHGVLLLAALATANPLFDGYRREEGPFGRLYFRGGRISSRDDRVDLIDRRLRDLEARLRRPLDDPITVVLVPDRAEFSRIVTAITDREPTTSTLGVAFPARRLVVAREDAGIAGARPWEQPGVTLDHELAHLVIHGDGPAHVPRWFDEGTAMWLSQGSISPRDEARLAALARVGGLFRLRHIEHRFPTLHHPGALAYQQSLMMVTFLEERYGPGTIADLLAALDSSPGFAAAYEKRTGESWEDFEPSFVAWMVSRRTLFEALAAVVNFWTVITFLALIAMAVEAVRRRKARRRLAADEALEGADGGAGPPAVPLAPA